ncbi:MAG: YvcK family protein [Caldilineaceae bacterium]|nr:YvcK family protein [Caldilineaceae bacterium]
MSTDQTNGQTAQPLSTQPAYQQTAQQPGQQPGQSTHTDGIRIVAIGGGTGMPQLLRGLRAYTDHITAIVTVADDGGSSGRLRTQMGILPPGDFRNNIAALSDAEELMTRLFQYRFPNQDLNGRSTELAGHRFGNLFIATMAAITGSFEKGLAESARVLAVRGRVLPSTLEHLTLCAEIIDRDGEGHEQWRIVEGESNLPNAGGQIQRVFLKPDQPRAYPEVIRSILQADLIVAGPGSFFTSVMPNLLAPAIRDAICATSVPRIYLCNVATQPGETDGYSVTDHMDKLREHAGEAFVTVLANHRYDTATPPYAIGNWVTLPTTTPTTYRLFTGDLVEEKRPWHHSPEKLAARLLAVYQELCTATDASHSFDVTPRTV